jgi:hypothetical protein
MASGQCNQYRTLQDLFRGNPCASSAVERAVCSPLTTFAGHAAGPATGGDGFVTHAPVAKRPLPIRTFNMLNPSGELGTAGVLPCGSQGPAAEAVFEAISWSLTNVAAVLAELGL